MADVELIRKELSKQLDGSSLEDMMQAISKKLPIGPSLVSRSSGSSEFIPLPSTSDSRRETITEGVGSRSRVTEIESKGLLTEYSKKIETPNRVLYREGELIILGEKRKTYWFFLFSDLLLWAKPLMNNKFKFKGEIDMRKAEVVSRSQQFTPAAAPAKEGRPTGSPDTRRQSVNPSQPIQPAQQQAAGGGALGTFRRELANLRGSSPQDIKNSIQIVSDGKMMSLHAKKDRELWLKDLQRIVDEFDYKRVFGVPLIELLTKRNQRNNEVPTTFQKLLDSFNESTFKTEGLFRLAASKTEVDQLRMKVDEGIEVDFAKENPHAVANLIKMFLRELAEPILTWRLYDAFYQTVMTKDSNPEAKNIMINLVHVLPVSNRVVLVELLRFLKRVTQYSKENFMSPQNLGIVFEPNMLRKKQRTTINQANQLVQRGSVMMAELTQNEACSGLIEWMIVNADDVINLSEKGVHTNAPLPASATQEDKPHDEAEDAKIEEDRKKKEEEERHRLEKELLEKQQKQKQEQAEKEKQEQLQREKEKEKEQKDQKDKQKQQELQKQKEKENEQTQNSEEKRIETVLNDGEQRALFLKHLGSDKGLLLSFWLEIEQFRLASFDSSLRKRVANDLFTVYLSKGTSIRNMQLVEESQLAELFSKIDTEESSAILFVPLQKRIQKDLLKEIEKMERSAEFVEFLKTQQTQTKRKQILDNIEKIAKDMSLN